MGHRSPANGAALTAQLYKLASALRANLTDLQAETYAESLGQTITADDFALFVEHALATDLWPDFFPRLAELRQAYRAWDDARHGLTTPATVEAEAVQAYERVIAAANWTPDGGSSWNYRDVLDRCQRAAANAFLEAGGHNAFATTWQEDKRRQRFLAAYEREARAEPASRLLLAGPQPMLEQGQQQEPTGATRPEAAQAMASIREHAQRLGVDVAAPTAPSKDPTVVVADPERIARLKAQAEG